MEIKRLTIKNGEIGFYGDIYNKCSNKNDPEIRKQIESGTQYCDIKGYKYHQYSHKELSAIYKKLSLFEDIMEKHLIETPEMLDVRLSENSNVNKMFATKITNLEAKLAESEKKASKNYQEGYDLYLSLKQFYSRLGVEAYPDDEIQDVAVKELNKLLKENDQLKQQSKN